MAFSVLRGFLKCSKCIFETASKTALLENQAKNKLLLDPCICAISGIHLRFNSSTPVNLAKTGAKTKRSAPIKDYRTTDSSDSDLESLGHRGDTDFWRRKIRTFHSILDVNKDGVISYDDFKLLAERFISLGHLSPRHTNEFRGVLKDLWEKRWGEITPYNLVTVEQFLEDMHHVINDKSLVRKAHTFLPYLFRAVDKDQSGAITVDEFKLFFECLGLKSEDALLAFRLIDSDADGKITLKEFVKHGRDFFLSEDENRISKYFWGPLVDH